MMRWILGSLVLAALNLLSVDSAMAQYVYPDQAAAHAACIAARAEAIGRNEGYGLSPPMDCSVVNNPESDSPYYSCRVRISSGWRCSNSYTQNFLWPKSGSCSRRADIVNARFQGRGGACSGGCAYAPVIGGGESGSVKVIGGATFYSYSRLGPTGDTCSVSNDTPAPVVGEDDDCAKQGNLTQCVKKDGTLCTQASNGRQFCWSPDESGIKTSGNEAASKVPTGKDAKLPPVAPKNGGDWEKVGETSFTITDTKAGSTSTKSGTVNNYNSSYGQSGSGASGNGGSGQGNGGSGSGGDGEGEEGDGDGSGSAGQGVGDLYKSHSKTVASVFAEFKARVGESPLIAAINGFFTVNAGGACPAFSVQASTYWEAMTFDAHCGGDLNAALHAMGWVLMAIAALAAAYWALS